MKYTAMILVCAGVFLVCFLIDTLMKWIFPKSKLEKSKQVVRLPRRSAIFGVLLCFFSMVILLFLMPKEGDTLLLIGCIVAMLMGAVLLVNYFSFAIYYDDEVFLYKNLKHKKTQYHYSQITGQRSLVTRGGVNSTLYVAGEELNVYSAMQGLNTFLNKAFYSWCKAKGIDPDTVENNPRLFTWFPEPKDNT